LTRCLAIDKSEPGARNGVTRRHPSSASRQLVRLVRRRHRRRSGLTGLQDRVTGLWRSGYSCRKRSAAATATFGTATTRGGPRRPNRSPPQRTGPPYGPEGGRHLDARYEVPRLDRDLDAGGSMPGSSRRRTFGKVSPGQPPRRLRSGEVRAHSRTNRCSGSSWTAPMTPRPSPQRRCTPGTSCRTRSVTHRPRCRRYCW